MAGYLDFAPALTERRQIVRVLEEHPGRVARSADLARAFAAWWQAHEPILARLPGTTNLMALRGELLASFEKALTPVGLLDGWQVAGVAANWWTASQYEFRTVQGGGFEDLVDGWVNAVADRANGDEDGGDRPDPFAHKIVVRLLPDYLRELAEAVAQREELELRARFGGAEDGEEEGAEELTPEQRRQLQKDLAGARRAERALRDGLVKHLAAARRKLDEDGCRRLVLDLAREDLRGQLERGAAAHRQRLVDILEGLWDKYRVPARDLEAARDRAARRLAERLQELGYGG